MAIPANRKSNREKPATGNTNGLCIGVFAYQDVYKGNVSERMLYLFEIDERYKGGPTEGKRHLVSCRYTNYISPPGAKKSSKLKQMLVAWKGAIPDGDFDLEADVGRPALLNLVPSDDGQYVNVDSVGPLPKGMAPLTRETPEDYKPTWIIELLKGKTQPTSEWTPADEDQPAGEETQVDPLEEKRQKARARFAALLHSQAFSNERKEEMKAKVTGAQLPSIEFMLTGWEEEARAFDAKLSAAGETTEKVLF